MYLEVLNESDSRKFSNCLNNGNWIVLYYADWCGHCKQMKPEWEKLVDMFKGNQNINIADVESSYIDKLTMPPTIIGYPTIKMYNNGKHVADYEGIREADPMAKFAISNSSKAKTLNTLKNITQNKRNNNSKKVTGNKVNILINKKKSNKKTKSKVNANVKRMKKARKSKVNKLNKLKMNIN